MIGLPESSSPPARSDAYSARPDRMSDFVDGCGFGCLGVVSGVAGIAIVWCAIDLVKKHFVDGIAVYFVGLLFAPVATNLIAFAIRHFAQTAAFVRMKDPRPPILLLRNFEDDFQQIKRHSSLVSFLYWGFFRFFTGEKTTLEQVVANELRRFGPVVAVAKPREALPPRGFARMWLPDEWRDSVAELIEEAQLIVVILGEIHGADDGLGWELATILNRKSPERVVVAVPPRSGVTRLWDAFCQASDGRLRCPLFIDGCFLTFSSSWAIKQVGSAGGHDRHYRKALKEVVELKRQILNSL